MAACQFKVRQRFEGVHTGNVREITAVDSYTVSYTIHYADGRKSSLYGVSKRQVREMLDARDKPDSNLLVSDIIGVLWSNDVETLKKRTKDSLRIIRKTKRIGSRPNGFLADGLV